MHKINPWAFAVAAGVLWGLSVFFMTLLGTAYNYGGLFLKMLEGIYPGFSVSVGGSLWGLVVGFLDAFIGGLLLIWLYNFLDCCCPGCKSWGCKGGTCSVEKKEK